MTTDGITIGVGVVRSFGQMTGFEHAGDYAITSAPPVPVTPVNWGEGFYFDGGFAAATDVYRAQDNCATDYR